MKKLLSILLAGVLVLTSTPAFASTNHTVQSGDTMWKIASKYQVGCQELIDANKNISNPNLLYVGQKLTIPVQDTSHEQEILKLVNEERAKVGAKPLTLNWELSRVARYKSEDMRDNKYFSHTSPTYGTPFQMIKNFGISYTSAGENIAQGYNTPEAVMKAWMNSPGHKANILNTKYTQLGVGYANNGSYWTQMFISK